MTMPNNSIYLQDWRERRAKAAAARVENVLCDLEKRGASMTLSNIAKNAEVSRSWLYESGFAGRAKALRDSGTRLPASDGGASLMSLRQRLADAVDDNKRLRSGVQVLREQLGVALGQRRFLS